MTRRTTTPTTPTTTTRPNTTRSSIESSFNVERLESRLLMSATLSGGGSWNFNGTNAADDIYIGRDSSQPAILVAEINGQQVQSQHESDVRRIRILGRNGDDRIQVDESAGVIDIFTIINTGNGNDQVFAGSGRNRIIGGNGNDEIHGGSSRDFINAGRGDDFVIGGAGNDRIMGGSGHDELYGNEGVDIISGGSGDDYIEGGDGKDRLRGGRGNDEIIQDNAPPVVDPEVPPTVEVTNRVPAEWETHDSTWLQWPKGEETYLRENFAGIIGILQAYEQVNLAVETSAAQTQAQRYLQDRDIPLNNIQFHIMPYNWSWMRDNGAIWVEKTDGSGNRSMAVQDWGFDAWGGDGAFAKDDAVPSRVAQIEGVEVEKVDLILEKGGLEFNGKDTVIANWTTVLRSNPSQTKPQVEALFQEKFGVTKVVWLEGSLEGDITEGHVDGIARFVNQNTVVVNRIVDPYDPSAQYYENAASTIASAGLNVVRLDIQGYVNYYGEELEANYANYLVANGVVIASSFGNAQFDAHAKQQLEALFPNRDVRLTDTLDLWISGGAVHCVTNDQPRLIV